MRGARIIVDSTSSSIRKMSAFWAAGKDGVRSQESILPSKRQEAKVDRIGRMVKVYRKESRHRMNPKPMICLIYQLRQNGERVLFLGHLFDSVRNVKKIADSLPFHFLMRVKVCGK